MTLQENIIRLLRAGKKPWEIKAATGCRSSTVRYCRFKMGMPPFRTGRRRGLTAAVRAKGQRARELRAQGKTLREIALEFGVSKQRVSQWLQELMTRRAAVKH